MYISKGVVNELVGNNFSKYVHRIVKKEQEERSILSYTSSPNPVFIPRLGITNHNFFHLKNVLIAKRSSFQHHCLTTPVSLLMTPFQRTHKYTPEPKHPVRPMDRQRPQTCSISGLRHAATQLKYQADSRAAKTIVGVHITFI